jgi:hypothetical protein
MFTTNNDNPKPWPTSEASASATTIDTTASPSGTSPATSEPNTSSRTTSAAGRPNSSSPSRRSWPDSSSKSRSAVASPTSSMSKPPRPSVAWTTSTTGSTSSPRSGSGTRTAWRSGETAKSSTPTAATAAASSTPVASAAWRSRWSWSWKAGSSAVSVWERTTTTSVGAEPLPSRSASSSCPRLESVGVVTSAVLVSASPRKLAISTTDTTTATAQPPRTRHGRLAQARATRSVTIHLPGSARLLPGRPRSSRQWSCWPPGFPGGPWPTAGQDLADAAADRPAGPVAHGVPVLQQHARSFWSRVRAQARGRVAASGTTGSVPCDLLAAPVPGAPPWGLHGYLLGRGRLTPLLPPGDPALPTPRRCCLAPWDRSMLHRVTSMAVVGSVRRTWSSSRPRSRTLAGRPCRAAWSATGPVTVVWLRSSQLTWRPSNQADQRIS